jgi:hypothetical protein
VEQTHLYCVDTYKNVHNATVDAAEAAAAAPENQPKDHSCASVTEAIAPESVDGFWSNCTSFLEHSSHADDCK